LEGGRFTFHNAMLGKVSLSTGSVARIYFPGADQSPSDVAERVREMSLAADAGDILLVDKKEGGPVSVEGVLKGLAEEDGEAKVTFTWGGRDRKLPASSVRAMLLAGIDGAPAGASRGVLTGRAGCQVSFDSFELKGEQATVTNAGFGKRTLRRDAIARVRFRSERLVPLSDITPASVREHGFFDTSFPHRANRSVGGGPLMLDGREYRNGLGLHSFCELVYRLDGKYERLAAVVGIDDAVRPLGDAALTLLGDGKPLGETLRLRGVDPARLLRVDLEGVQQLTVRVEFGADGLDVSDHVDLGGARLIRPEKELSAR
jgi:NPCBM/NEW2 domain